MTTPPLSPPLNWPDPETSATPSEPRSLLQRIQHTLRAHLVETIGISVGLTLILFSASAWNLWSIYRGFNTEITRQFLLQDLSNTIVYLDEVLTMSSRMAASTANLDWERRYRQFVPQLDNAIEQLVILSPETYQANAQQTDAANIKLIALEDQSFDLVRQGRSQEALDLLLGPDYEDQKQIYSAGIENTLQAIQSETDAELQLYQQRLIWSLGFAGLSFPVILLTWVGVAYGVRSYIQERNQAQAALLKSQQALLNLNQDLEGRVQQRTQQLIDQEQDTREENQLIETEVSHLLDIVSALEAGDLTAHAQVSDRVTGLVADTLNRLIEELGRVLSETFYATQQVSEGADYLQHMAALVTENTEFQVRSVTQVQALMEQVDRLAQFTTQQAVESNEAVEQAEDAVHQGQEQMAQLTQGLAQLQERTEQITQRSITLSNFVQLAEQFVQDQRRIASLTRVLALNASMIAARAAGQTDPDQFASVAREFETIATQVNNLAVQTNQGLMVLQQRTSQIQTVVSGVNQDVDEIGQVVAEFSQHAQATDHSFGEISTSTRQVVAITQEMLQSSRTISSAAQNTLDSIRGITTSASETAHQAGLTRQQVSRTQGLVSALLDRVEFFQLPPELMAHQPQTGSAPLPTPDSIPPLDPGDPQRVANGRQPSPSLASSQADS